MASTTELDKEVILQLVKLQSDYATLQQENERLKGKFEELLREYTDYIGFNDETEEDDFYIHWRTKAALPTNGTNKGE